MQLVACSGCHTQYDVTDVALDRFTCRCGLEVENRVHDAVDAKVLRCGSCGAILPGEEPTCGYCGSEVVRDPGGLSIICPECYAACAVDARFCTACGIPFRPEEVRIDGHELPCPACGALMPPHQVGGLAVNGCAGCGGLWVPGQSFESLVARAIETRRGASPEELLRLRPRQRDKGEFDWKVEYRKCPECQAFMQRRNFRKSSGVILDVCHEHGTWLDVNELEEIAAFILRGGETSETIRSEERSAESAFRQLRIERIRQAGRGPRRGPDAAGDSLLEILAGLLS